MRGERGGRLRYLARHIPADVDHGVVGSGRGEVRLVGPVPAQRADAGQVGLGPAPVEDGHLPAAAQPFRGEGPPDEHRSTDHEKLHGHEPRLRRRTRGRPCADGERIARAAKALVVPAARVGKKSSVGVGVWTVQRGRHLTSSYRRRAAAVRAHRRRWGRPLAFRRLPGTAHCTTLTLHHLPVGA